MPTGYNKYLINKQTLTNSTSLVNGEVNNNNNPKVFVYGDSTYPNNVHPMYQIKNTPGTVRHILPLNLALISKVNVYLSKTGGTGTDLQVLAYIGDNKGTTGVSGSRPPAVMHNNVALTSRPSYIALSISKTANTFWLNGTATASGGTGALGKMLSTAPTGKNQTTSVEAYIAPLLGTTTVRSMEIFYKVNGVDQLVWTISN